MEPKMAPITQFLIAVAAVGGLFVSIWNANQIGGVHILINSRMSELLALTQAASRAEGLKEGRDEKRSK